MRVPTGGFVFQERSRCSVACRETEPEIVGATEMIDDFYVCLCSHEDG